ncbi:MAG: hypothetical protein PVJ67_02480 [Candidatus Pacearchaeota archaeon]|jgi:hypothetical protein
MKKISYVIIGVIFLLLVLLAVRFIFGGPEDTWIKDENGLYVEHGSPAKITEEAVEQQELILGAMKLYYEKAEEGMNFSSQCLGTVENYAIDIVHVPRIQEDDLEENQCEEYKNGNVKHFIELDLEGNVIKIN